jgi:nitrite reductase/ring-hydroxylating ferredoxin subunit
VPTGKAVQAPCEIPLRTYRVVPKDDDIFVDLDRNAAGEPV